MIVMYELQSLTVRRKDISLGTLCMSRDIMCIKRNNNNAMIHKSPNLTYIINPSLQFKAKIQLKHHDCYLHYTVVVKHIKHMHPRIFTNLILHFLTI